MIIQSVIDFDRMLLPLINGNNSSFLDGWMYVLTSGLTWIPLYVSLLYLVIKNNETMSQILLVVGCALLCIVISDGMADFIVKPLVARPRPCNDVELKYSVEIVNHMRSRSFSFFSAHAANTFSLALFFCLWVKSRLLSTVLVGWSLLNGYTRLYLAQHYPSDVIVGYAWGAVSAFVAYRICKAIYSKISTEKNFISTQYTSTGYLRSNVDIVCVVFVCTLICSVFASILFI